MDEKKTGAEIKSGPGAANRPYAAGVTGADTARMGGSEHLSARERAEAAAEAAREQASHAYDWAEHAYEDSSRWAKDRFERGSEWASDTYDEAARTSRRSYRRARDGAGEFIDENPLIIGALGLAAGLLIGALLPISRKEHRVFGPVRDDLRERGYRYGRDAVQRARHVAEEGYRAGYEEARRRGMTPSQMADSARDVGKASYASAEDAAKDGDDHGAGNKASAPLGPR